MHENVSPHDDEYGYISSSSVAEERCSGGIVPAGNSRTCYFMIQAQLLRFLNTKEGHKVTVFRPAGTVDKSTVREARSEMTTIAKSLVRLPSFQELSF